MVSGDILGFPRFPVNVFIQRKAVQLCCNGDLGCMTWRGRQPWSACVKLCPMHSDACGLEASRCWAKMVETMFCRFCGHVSWYIWWSVVSHSVGCEDTFRVRVSDLSELSVLDWKLLDAEPTLSLMVCMSNGPWIATTIQHFIAWPWWVRYPLPVARLRHVMNSGWPDAAFNRPTQVPMHVGLSGSSTSAIWASGCSFRCLPAGRVQLDSENRV